MKIGFYGRLAAEGIRKNKRLYIPYILTCVGIVMMFYIISFLSTHELLDVMKSGGRTMKEILYLGWWVIGIFAVFFLFYTHSFLVRRRKKEFGLYNILGMGKRHLGRVLLVENIIISLLSIGGGLILGILFSKIAELAMVNLLHGDISFGFSVSLIAVRNTALFFLGIFTLIFLNTLKQIHLSKPIELLGSEKAGEKQPKTRWIMAALGIILIISAYVISVSIEKPLMAMAWFFIAVIMVIIGTYLLFIAASVALCKILRNIKSYYYRTNHFVSVSSMAYRMKRNGAGLATICILCTMVLVMISSTLCLYLGAEKILRLRYSRDFSFDIYLGQEPDHLDSNREGIVNLFSESAAEQGLETKNIINYSMATLSGARVDGGFQTYDPRVNDFSSANDFWSIVVISIADYNRLTGANVSVSSREVLIQTTSGKYSSDQITVGNAGTFEIMDRMSDFPAFGSAEVQPYPTIYIFVPDLKNFVTPLIQSESDPTRPNVQLSWHYEFNVSDDEKIQAGIYQDVMAKIRDCLTTGPDQDWQWFSLEPATVMRAQFYELYGGMFFLGILLAIVFVFATVLIIYYKQISEGYEDRERFDIMQKVGMTRKEIKKAVNSQVLTVFFLPILTAGLHLVFAFPLVSKLLALFGLNDVPFLIMVTAGCFLVFGLLYIFVYRVTSRAYFNIVSDGQRE